MVTEFEAFRRRSAATQESLATLLGISQGHLSKILAGKVPLTGRVRLKIELVLAGNTPESEADSALENQLIEAMRTSESFRELVRAAIKMHKEEK